jgi:protein-L-isoaspartate(D-aspartate) O-methyltransferase
MQKLEIQSQLKDKGITNPQLLKAFEEIPPAYFLSKKLYPFENVTIDDNLIKVEPRVYSVAKMLENLKIKQGEKILAIGVDSV